MKCLAASEQSADNATWSSNHAIRLSGEPSGIPKRGTYIRVLRHLMMDDPTRPRSPENAVPIETMKASSGRAPSPSRTPILEESQQPQTYNTMAPSNSNPAGAQNIAEVSHESNEEDGREPYDEPHNEPQPWLGERIWTTIKRWELNHLELVLENRQSVARDHLANERTYLAWLRTSLSFASIGVAITQLFRLSTTIQPDNSPKGFATLRRVGRPLGATFVGIAVFVLALGVHRYFMSQYWMTQGKFPASRGAVLLVSGITASITIAAFVIVIIIDPDVAT